MLNRLLRQVSRARTVLILGGARSGKSRFAERSALGLSRRPIYLATSRYYDEDHCRRIERHRRERGAEWTTLEEDRTPSRVAPRNRVVVFDCVTLWLSNLLADAGGVAEDALATAELELNRLFAIPNTWFFVSNELGQSLHPATELGRKFVDLQGSMNQRIAARAGTVVCMTAGIPTAVKGTLPRATPAVFAGLLLGRSA